MGLIKNLWKSLTAGAKEKETEKETSSRIAAFENLQKDDFIELGALEIIDLSGKSVQITGFREFKDMVGAVKQKELIGLCENTVVHLTKDPVDDGNVVITKKQKTGEVIDMLKENDIHDLIESEDGGVNVHAKDKNHNNPWYGNIYRKAFFMQGDMIRNNNSYSESESVDYYLLQADNGVNVILMYVYDDRTEVYVGISINKDSLIREFFLS